MTVWDDLWANATASDTNPHSWLGKLKIEGDKTQETLEAVEALNQSLKDTYPPNGRVVRIIKQLDKILEGFAMRGLTKEQLEYLFRKYVGEVRDEHLYDAERQLAWYTGFGMTLSGDVYELDRSDGAYAFWRDTPYVEITEEEYRELIGREKEAS